ncbi:MAG: endo-1,4-beta-xylanase [Candidatus Hodarchaeota archaeon]
MSRKKITKKARIRIGFFLLLFTAGSFTFLLLEPLIPNPIGEALDDEFLSGIDDKIRDTRTSPFTITLQYANGTLLDDVDVQYNLTNHEFYFGCTYFDFNEEIANGSVNYQKYFKQTFNLAVLPFFWQWAEPEQGVLWQEPWLNLTLTWCELNNITVKGTPIAWATEPGTPEWLSPDDEAKKQSLQARVEYVVEKYKDRVKIWDVVNEPVRLPPFYGDSTFQYVADAFGWAHSKDSGATLSINDFGILGQDFGDGPYFNLIKEELDAGTPIGCVGIQSHEPRTDWFPAVNMWQTFEGYSSLGIPIHLTEIMVTSASLPITNSWKKGLWSEENQAEYLERLYKTAFAHPSVEAVIYWELWEGAEWMEGTPLIKTNWEPKRAYNRISNLVNNEWHSEGTTKTNISGILAFTGFHGTYNITIPLLGQTFQINLESGDTTHYSIIV